MDPFQQIAAEASGYRAQAETWRRDSEAKDKRIAELTEQRDALRAAIRDALTYVKGNSYMAQNVRGFLKPALKQAGGE